MTMAMKVEYKGGIPPQRVWDARPSDGQTLARAAWDYLSPRSGSATVEMDNHDGVVLFATRLPDAPGSAPAPDGDKCSTCPGSGTRWVDVADPRLDATEDRIKDVEAQAAGNAKAITENYALMQGHTGANAEAIKELQDRLRVGPADEDDRGGIPLVARPPLGAARDMDPESPVCLYCDVRMRWFQPAGAPSRWRARCSHCASTTYSGASKAAVIAAHEKAGGVDLRAENKALNTINKDLHAQIRDAGCMHEGRRSLLENEVAHGVKMLVENKALQAKLDAQQPADIVLNTMAWGWLQNVMIAPSPAYGYRYDSDGFTICPGPRQSGMVLMFTKTVDGSVTIHQPPQARPAWMTDEIAALPARVQNGIRMAREAAIETGLAMAVETCEGGFRICRVVIQTSRVIAICNPSGTIELGPAAKPTGE